MQEKPPDDLLGAELHDLLSIGIRGVPISEANRFVVLLDQTMVRDSDPVGIPSEISNDVIGVGKWTFTINVPILSVEASDCCSVRRLLQHTGLPYRLELRQELPTIEL